MPAGVNTPSAGMHGFGTKFYTGPAFPVAENAIVNFTELAEVIEISGVNGVEVAKTKMTHLRSPNGYHEFKPGLATSKDVTFKLNYTRATAVTVSSKLGSVMSANTWYYFKTELPNGDSDAFLGFVSDIGDEVPEDDRVTRDVTITVTGMHTFAAGT